MYNQVYHDLTENVNTDCMFSISTDLMHGSHTNVSLFSEPFSQLYSLHCAIYSYCDNLIYIWGTIVL